MTLKVFRVHDAEGDPISMDIVRVPEGFSFQMYDRQTTDAYMSVIVNTDTIEELRDWLLEKLHSKE